MQESEEDVGQLSGEDRGEVQGAGDALGSLVGVVLPVDGIMMRSAKMKLTRRRNGCRRSTGPRRGAVADRADEAEHRRKGPMMGQQIFAAPGSRVRRTSLGCPSVPTRSQRVINRWRSLEFDGVGDHARLPARAHAPFAPPDPTTYTPCCPLGPLGSRHPLQPNPGPQSGRSTGDSRLPQQSHHTSGTAGAGRGPGGAPRAPVY